MAPYFSNAACTWATVDFFWTAGNVDAVYIRILLRKNGIDGAGGLADLAVADNQLTLPRPTGVMASTAFRPV